MPLVWAHAEYLTLLRSVADGQVFDFLPHVAARYPSGRTRGPIEFWKPNRYAPRVAPGQTLRIQGHARFTLHWSADEWRTAHDTPSRTTPLDIDYVDLPVAAGQQAPLRFTFHWTADNRWEGKDYAVPVVP
jgi:glucoamylase